MHVPARRGRPKTNARPQGFDLSPPLPEGSSRRLNLSNTGNKKRTVTRIQNRAARELLRELLKTREDKTILKGRDEHHRRQ